MPRLGLEDIPKAGLIRSDQFLMFAILFMACMVSSWATTRPADSLVDGGERRVRTRHQRGCRLFVGEESVGRIEERRHEAGYCGGLVPSPRVDRVRIQLD